MRQLDGSFRPSELKCGCSTYNPKTIQNGVNRVEGCLMEGGRVWGGGKTVRLFGVKG